MIDLEAYRLKTETCFRCSFCGADNSSVKELISSPGIRSSGAMAFICPDCVLTCFEVMDELGCLPPERIYPEDD